MPDINIFQDDAFSVTSLSAAINEQEYVPGRISELGIFQEEGITTTTVQIEKDGESLKLVSAASRGDTGQIVLGDKRNLIPFNTVHLPQRSTILADEIQNLRAFGSQTELETVVNYVAKRLAKHRRQLDATHEFHRIGAIKGLILDADGTTALVDLFDRFGLNQQTVTFQLNAPDTDIANKCLDVQDKIETALGAVSYSNVRVLCGRTFWSALIGHKNIRETYLNTQQASALRGDPRDSFDFGGCTFERYRGKVGTVAYVADAEAYAFPEGVPDLFVTNFAPGDYLETVNTLGLPYYSAQAPLEMNKGVKIESQSNPLHLCTRPRASIKLKLQ